VNVIVPVSLYKFLHHRSSYCKNLSFSVHVQWIDYNNNGKTLLLAKWVLARRLCTRRLCTSSSSLSESEGQIWKHVSLKIFWTRECVLHSIFLDFSKGYMTTWLELVKKSQLGPRVKRPKNTLYYSLHGSNNPCKLVIVYWQRERTLFFLIETT
jgi:hypothetical protein